MKYCKCLGIIFVFCLLLLPLAPNAHAAERWEDGWNAAISYEFDAATGTVSLSGTGEITINDSYRPWGNYPKDVKKVVINEGITGIAAYTFRGLQNLTEVVLPRSLTTIVISAFQGCNALTSIDLSYVTSLEESAFSGCSALTAVDISRVTYLGSYTFKDSGLHSITIPKTITVIPRGAFMNCQSLGELILHDQVTKIGYDAFNDCYKLTSLQMPKGLKELDDFAFADCIALTDIQLNNGLEIIGHTALGGCKALEKLVVPDSINQIEDNAFIGCTNLKSIHFGAGLSSVTCSAIQKCSNLTTLTINKNNAHFEIHNNGLYTKSPRKLVAIAPGYEGAYVIPEGTVSIDGWACSGGKITLLTIPGTVKLIDEYAFVDCKNLKTVSLGAGVEEIKLRAFTRSGITEITLPASIKKLGTEAFNGCTSLTKITFKGLPPEVKESVFGSLKADAYYPGYMEEWKDAQIKSTDFYLNYIPDCQGRHDLRWEVIKAPTCKETGWRSETWCIVCRQNVDPEGELPLADHEYGPWTTVTPPTTEKEGLSERTCNTCAVSEQKAIPKLSSSTVPPTAEPSIPPEATPSQPVTSEPPAESPSEPLVTSPPAPEETEPSATGSTEQRPPEDSTPARWISVVNIAAASILIGMVTAFLIFALKKKKSKE